MRLLDDNTYFYPVTKEEHISILKTIPGVGKSIASDLWNIGIANIEDLKEILIN